MSDDEPEFADLMIDAQRVVSLMDQVTRRDGSNTIAAFVRGGKLIYARLQQYQRSAWLTAAEAHAIQETLDLIRARLRFFGESV